MSAKYRLAFLLLFVLGSAALLTSRGWTQDAKQDASVARMKKDIFFLASDACEGRGVGTLGLDLAAQYIAVQFSQAGLKPGGVNGTYFQPFPFATGAQADGESTLVIEGPEGKKFELKQGTDFQVVGSSAPGKRSAPLVFVGYGLYANGIAYDDYDGVDVKGKIVVALRRLPRWNDKEKPLVDAASKDALAVLDGKLYRGQGKGAAAVIMVNDASELPKDALVSLAITKGISTVSTAFVQMKRSVLDDILTASTGKDLADTEKAIDADLKPHSAPLKGWTAKLDVKIKRTEVMVKNVIGYLDGNGPLANEFVVVGSHYDHLGYGGFGALGGKPKAKAIYYGADDNGSGTTSNMELARRFAAKKGTEGRRMVFMAFTAEERGLIGSRHYTQVAPLFPLKDTYAMFNLDMVGRLKDPTDGAKPQLLVEGTGSAKEFDALVTKLNPGFDIVTKNSRGFFSSDQYNFYQQKIPVVFFWTGEHPDYHRPTDVPEKINLTGMKKIVDYAELVIDDFRTNPNRPQYQTVPFKFTGGGAGTPTQAPSLRFIPDIEYQGKGVLVEKIIEGGPADKAGLKAGDVIIEMAGKAVANIGAYNAVRVTFKSGVEIEIKILRDKKEMTLKITPVTLK